MNQRGFATLEVILMIMVIGILASIAVPRFTSVTTAANTAKIQSDLTTIDTAIAIYYMEHGTYPTGAITVLSDYIQGADKLKPPSGKAYIDGTEGTVADTYTLQSFSSGTGTAATTETRAVCGTDNTADKFYIPKKT